MAENRRVEMSSESAGLLEAIRPVALRGRAGAFTVAAFVGGVGGLAIGTAAGGRLGVLCGSSLVIAVAAPTVVRLRLDPLDAPGLYALASAVTLGAFSLVWLDRAYALCELIFPHLMSARCGEEPPRLRLPSTPRFDCAANAIFRRRGRRQPSTLSRATSATAVGGRCPFQPTSCTPISSSD